eukprot:349588-Chlamydomonas_euryale.AAC.7
MGQDLPPVLGSRHAVGRSEIVFLCNVVEFTAQYSVHERVSLSHERPRCGVWTGWHYALHGCSAVHSLPGVPCPAVPASVDPSPPNALYLLVHDPAALPLPLSITASPFSPVYPAAAAPLPARAPCPFLRTQLGCHPTPAPTPHSDSAHPPRRPPPTARPA